MLIENDKIILIFSTHSKPWAFAIDSGRGVVRLIPRCRRFAIGSSWWAVSRSKAVAVALDSGRGVGRLIPRCRPFAMAPAGEPSQAPSRGRFAIGSSW